MKQIGKFHLINHVHIVQSLVFSYFDVFFIEVSVSKKFSLRELLPLLGWRSIASIYVKNIYYLIIAVINEYFKFQKIDLK